MVQTGTGHFSPIGGYHAGQDMVLILDVARFKYPPHWVPLQLLWEAMNTTDDSTGLLRGYLLLPIFLSFTLDHFVYAFRNFH
jgi:glutathione gamma-glutamylcysteinyltransferase